MTLDAELNEYRRQISTDAYQMSIGELANLYRDGELNIHPEFQRLFRWEPAQRTRLIESVLLGIPLPSIFVATSDEGWDVVDGVQRLSTLFNFMGILRDPDGNILDPFECMEAPFLKLLKGVFYENSDPTISFSPTQRIDFKRARLDLKIIKRDSDKRAKFDLFQRLNSFGSQATDQELRNALLVSLSLKHFEWLGKLSRNADFLETLNLPEKLILEQYHMEIALRFILMRKLPDSEIGSIGYLGEFLTSRIVQVSELTDAELAAEEEVFNGVFSVLNASDGSDVLRKLNPATGKSQGPFAATAFETLALGIGYHDADGRIDAAVVRAKRRELWSDPAFAPGFSSGIRADQRLRTTVPFGRKLFEQAS
ncbi:DUF262 domain-containing protein [Nocardia sp. 348MFTsu5.1]|uniref:DUF262 domain-containing protein n=1 Tax=Nocardia sp. 348MFTsu5.1 TaxID=1172185 RepID=UPI00036D4FE6|nr:DUF262 domain-containing protein [Nocardia sp. 348MFTsu5.1]